MKPGSIGQYVGGSRSVAKRNQLFFSVLLFIPVATFRTECTYLAYKCNPTDPPCYSEKKYRSQKVTSRA